MGSILSLCDLFVITMGCLSGPEIVSIPNPGCGPTADELYSSRVLYPVQTPYEILNPVEGLKFESIRL